MNQSLQEKKIMPVIASQVFILSAMLSIVLMVALNFLLSLTAPTTINEAGQLVYVITDGFFFIDSFVVQLGFLFVPIILLFKNGFSFKDILSECGFTKKPKLIYILISIILPFVTIYAFEPITDLFIKLLNLFGYESAISYMPDFTLTKNYILGLIFAALVPAFCEEILFRGVILNGFRKLGNRKAILLTGLCFVLMHQSPDQTVYQFLMGIVLSSIVVISGSIWTSIIVHFVNNAFTLTLAKIGLTSSILPSLNVGFIVISVVLCGLIYVGIHFGLKKVEEDRKYDDLVSVDKTRTRGNLIVGSAICLALWVINFITGLK